ncbi:MAG TPA: type VI secretion system protein [Variovorax sp.]
MNALLSPDHRLWLLLSLCLLGFGLLYAVVRDAGRGARRRGLQKRVAALGNPAAGTNETAIAALGEGMAQAQQAMRRAPRARAAAPVPWFLCFGDAAANLAGLFATAHGERVDTSGDGAWWRWWLTPRLMAIEIDASAVGDMAGTPQQRGLWLHSLLALAERRDRLPLNGLVVAVAATDLLSADPAELQSRAARTRRLLDETSDTLRLQMPTYLVVTGLERLAGYETLHGALPPEVLAQVLGHRLTDPSAFIETPAGERLDAVFEPIAQQVHALRMALLREQPGATGRLAIHEFVEAVRALQPGLRQFAQVLFANQGRNSRAPRWRGFYLTAAASDATGGAFVSDLFERFLPVDQPLVRPGRPL